MQLKGAQILVRSLIDQGVEIVFGYPGGTVLNIYDALYEYRDEIPHIVTSHEQGATHAADGYARSTGRTGVVVATSGPGATNLVTGLATAFHDSVPLVAVTANVAMDLIGRDSFQEVDIVGVTNPVVKHNYLVKDAAELAGVVREAFVIANSGRKGPVLIDIPKNVTAELAEYTPLPRFTPRPAVPPREDELQAAAAAIAASKRPLIYAGGGVNYTDATESLRAFAEKIHAPVCNSMLGLGTMPAGSPLFLGMIGMHGTATANTAALNCDLLITVGARFSDRVAGNRQQFAADAAIIHIDIDPSEICKNVEADLPVIGEARECLEKLTAMVPPGKRPDWVRELLHHKAHNALPIASSQAEGGVNPREIIQKLRQVVGEDALIVTDVGQHQMYTAQYYPFTRPRSFITSAGLGTMGFGMGAAVGVKYGSPDRNVALITGDGCFHMNMAELAVAVSNDLPVVVLVFNNGVLGMVHQWQRLFYGSRYAYTEINRKTDYKLLAEAFGALGFRIATPEDILPVLTQAVASGRPCVVDCIIDQSQRVFPIIPPGGSGTDMIFSDESDQ